MSKKRYTNEHSESVQDIMGRIPGWIVRWGLLVVALFFAGLIIACCFIKYPQTVAGNIIITTINPPIELHSRTTGKIERLFFENNQRLNRDDMVAIIYNTANHEDIFCLYDSISNYQVADLIRKDWLYDNYNLGELQAVFVEFVRLCGEYKEYLELDYNGIRRNLLSRQIENHKSYLSKQKRQLDIVTKERVYAENTYLRDSVLFSRELISIADFENTKRQQLQLETARVGYETSISATELSMLQMQQQLIEFSLEDLQAVKKYELNIQARKDELFAHFDSWIYQYIIKSPINGTISFSNYWTANQNIQSGERLATVIPEESMHVVGHMNIPSGGIGKVQEGQGVNVRLNGYPYMEYGILKGHIDFLSAVPEVTGYTAIVSFPNGLTTTYNKELRLIQQMDGQAEIITDDIYLIQHFLQPIKALFDK